MQDTVIVVTRDGLGTTADADFGATMLEKFFHTLEKRADKPRAICFYTEGVRCVADGAPYRLGLELLAGMGVRIVSCGTCLERYGIEPVVGERGGMDDIVELLDGAGKVVTV